MKRKLSLLFCLALSIVLFFIDISIFLIIEKQSMVALLCWYIIMGVQQAPVLCLLFTFFLLLLESFIFYGSPFSLSLITLIPIALLASQIRHTFYESRWVYYLLITIALLIQIIGVEHFGMGLPVSVSYTISRIIVNIIVMMILRSLK